MQRTNPTAIVTGGSQGIGLAIAIKLAQHNYQVIIADLTDVKEDALKELSSLMPKPHFIHCDISKEKDVMQLVHQIQQQFNGVDVLVNNAGIISKGSLTDISTDEWNRVFSINVNGPFMLSKVVIPIMQQQKRGRIINIASVAAQVGGGFLGNTCYAASKGAILSLTKGIAREYAAYNITCNAICPGFVETHLTSMMPKEQVEQALHGIPAHRPACPSEIADAVCFLAGDQSAYINGVTLNIDGGLIRY